MPEKKSPERTCVVCRKKFSQDELTRISLNKSGDIHIDEDSKTEGRGAYICKNCADKCVKTRAINRAYKRNVPDKIYEEIKAKLVK